MKTENCAEITDAKRIELKSGLAEPVKNDKYSSFIVPAGILIGLGVGLLVDYLLSGFFVGLGLGLICSELFRLVEKSREAESTQTGSVNVTTLLIGTFLVFIGFGIVLAPAAIWP
jgi:F0F1-type ATP synthase membrane subunit c/vacuolar-type H+-ATPase subunit K